MTDDDDQIAAYVTVGYGDMYVMRCEPCWIEINATFDRDEAYRQLEEHLRTAHGR